MRRINVEELTEELEISGETAHHLIYAYRARRGEHLIAVDSQGRRAEIELISFTKTTVKARISGEITKPESTQCKMKLAICLPKQNGLDEIIRAAVELGVSEIYPLISERTIARPSVLRAENKMTRWRRIASEASEQSGSAAAIINEIEELDDWLKHLPDGLLMFCNESERERSIAQVVRQYTDEIIILIGCEGGFSEREAHQIIAAGGESVSLGANVLKVRTAAISAISIVNYEFNNRAIA